ncbi:MAG: putative primase/helicase [Chthoniobacter sp.]|jgi:phage/plasmid-associated DNA primase|nr:putative primase/helicase [Chthoniobacter sp.]
MSQFLPKIVEYKDAGKDRFNELLCVRTFLRKNKVRTKDDQWYVWDGKAWQKRSKSAYLPDALDVLQQTVRQVRNAKSVLEHVEALQQLKPDEELRGAIAFSEDRTAVLINLDNGILRVTADSAALGKHDESMLFTGCLPSKWIEGVPEPSNFLRVLNDALPPDRDGSTHGQALLKWWCGYLLYPDTAKHELFLICYGPSGTGKSTVAEPVIGCLGRDPNVTSLTLAQICAGDKAYSVPKLEYALCNMGTELDTVDVEDASALKRIVSGEPVEARNIFGKPFTMRTTAKLWYLANDLPRFKHGTDAELRRVRFLHFDQLPKCPSCNGKGFIEDYSSHEPPKCEKCGGSGVFRDRTLKGAEGLLTQERDAIFAWMVRGLKDILAGVECPEGNAQSREVKAQFAVSNDPVRAFFESELVRDPDGEELKSEVADAFKAFMDHRGFPAKSTEALFRALYQRFPFIKAVKKREADEFVRYLTGVRLRHE